MQKKKREEKKISNRAALGPVGKKRKRVPASIQPWILAAVALAFVFAVTIVVFQEEITEVVETVATSDEPMFQHPLTGLPVYDPIKETLQVFGVMIDNHNEAWPPAGLEEAFLVIEAPVEAGISRMLAFYYEGQEVDVIGPVRSARPYYLDWNNELDALYAHVGGSNAALDSIASGVTFDINQYWNGEYFWRSNERFAPHNVFTSTENLLSYYQKRDELGYAPERLYGLWSFKTAEPEEEGAGLSIDFYAPIWTVDWVYDPESGQYLRDQSGYAHEAASGIQIVADNVVAVITDVSIIDNVGRRDIRTIGEGVAYVLQDGRVIEARWEKPSASERLRFYDREEEIVMNAGVTWIEVVPSEDSIEIE